MEYIIDLTSVYDPEGFHRRVREVLPVPVWYGDNLDALHDVLTEYGGGWTVRFLHPEGLRAACPRYAASLERLCRNVQKETPGLTAELI